MNIALAQFRSSSDKSANLSRISEFVARARRADADLVLFPEWAMVRVGPAGDAASAEPVDGPFVSSLASLARAQNIAIVVGVYESAPGAGLPYNTVVAIAPSGSLIGVYRKIHLFDAFGHRESDIVRAGDGGTLVFSLGDITFGVATCYDVRFPEVFRHLADRGAAAILLPADWAFGHLKESHWEVLVRARAIENTVYMAAAGQVGERSTGSSMLVDPMGVPIVRLGETEGMAVGSVDASRVADVRQTLPSRGHVRPDVYARWLPVPR